MWNDVVRWVYSADSLVISHMQKVWLQALSREGSPMYGRRIMLTGEPSGSLMPILQKGFLVSAYRTPKKEGPFLISSEPLSSEVPVCFFIYQDDGSPLFPISDRCSCTFRPLGRTLRLVPTFPSTSKLHCLQGKPHKGPRHFGRLPRVVFSVFSPPRRWHIYGVNLTIQMYICSERRL